MSGFNGSFLETTTDGGTDGFVEKSFDEVNANRRADRTKSTPMCLAATLIMMMLLLIIMIF
jgi:hypothetical protein